MKINTIVVFSATALTLSGIMFLPKALSPQAPCPLATGNFDQEAGASNQITTCKVLEALSLVEEGRIVPLGKDYEAGMPIFPGRAFEFQQKMPPEVPSGEEDVPMPTGGPFGDNLLIFNDGLLAGMFNDENDAVLGTEIDQVGTQFDGPGHIGRAQKAGDPTKGKYYLNKPVQQVNATRAEPEGGLRALGVEHVKPLVTSGILVDLAPMGTSDCAGQPCWDAGEEITLADVEAALVFQGLNLDDVESGDAVFFNTGWGHLWMVDNERFNSGQPGIGLEVAGWLVDREVVLVGSDNWAVEFSPSPPDVFPVHQVLITDNGIFLHENLTFEGLISEDVYEFMYMFMPVPIKGATGSPGSPLALF